MLDGARQVRAVLPPAVMLDRRARVIAVLLRQEGCVPQPAHFFAVRRVRRRLVNDP